jgi:hypothetical protein
VIVGRLRLRTVRASPSAAARRRQRRASPGEEVGAAVALKDGQRATPAELRAYMKENVAA